MADTYTVEDQFEEEINFIRTTDRVLGDPPGTTGTLTGPINVFGQKVLNSLRHLKNALDAIDTTVPNATTTEKGIAELATKVEAETGDDTTRITPPKRVFDILKHDNAKATDTTRGTVKFATQDLTNEGTDTETVISPGLLSGFFQNLNFPGRLSGTSPDTASWLTSDDTAISTEAELSDVQQFEFYISATNKVHLITAQLEFLLTDTATQFKIEINPGLTSVDWVFFNADLVYHYGSDPRRSISLSGSVSGTTADAEHWEYPEGRINGNNGPQANGDFFMTDLGHDHEFSDNFTATGTLPANTREYLQRAVLSRRLENTDDGEGFPIRLWRIDHTTDRRSLFNIMILAVES